jgi:hypothetical protein
MADAPWLWLPIQSKADVEPKLDDVQRRADCLHSAIIRSTKVWSEWGGRWANYYAELQKWLQQSHADLDDYGSNAQDAPRIIAECDRKNRELREWDKQARALGIEVPCERPPDNVSILGLDVSRTSLYVVGIGAAGLLALALSREGRAWLGVR